MYLYLNYKAHYGRLFSPCLRVLLIASVISAATAELWKACFDYTNEPRGYKLTSPTEKRAFVRI